MGSFNTTCFASGQTIAPGDRCFVIPIVQSSTYSPVTLVKGEHRHNSYGATHSICGVAAFWGPAAAPVPAKYADYGRFELELNASSRQRLQSFLLTVRKYAPVVLKGDNDRHDLGLDFDEWLRAEAPGLSNRLQGRLGPAHAENEASHLDDEMRAAWDVVFTVASKHRLFMGNSLTTARPVQFAVMHQHAYEALAGLKANSVDWKGRSFQKLDFCNRVAEEAIAELGQAGVRRQATSQQERMTAGYLAVTQIADGFRSVCDSIGLHLPLSRDVLYATVSQHLERGTWPSGQELLDALGDQLDDRYMFGGLELLSLRLSPMVYTDQDYSNDIGAKYAAFVAKVSAQVSEDRRSDDV